MTPEPGHTLSHYTLVEKIGEGGMGVVFKAHDSRLNRHVAVKVLRPDVTRDADRQRRFLGEARAAAAVSHPGIATVHEIDEAGGVTFIVMELVEGSPLGSLIRGQPMPTGDALHIAIQVAEALARAHGSRIIHKDLKPDNIIVGADRRAKILDFGLAQILRETEPRAERPGDDEAITRDLAPGRLIGTAGYMSPEQARGEPVDARSDIFSFGVVLYEMLAGQRPFKGGNITSTLARILEAEPEPIARVRPDLPARLHEVVERCLRKDPAARFSDGGDLASALREVEQIVRSGRSVAPAPVSKASIAVFPFSFSGSAEFGYLSAGLVDLLSTKLDGAGELHAVDPHVVLCCAAPDAGGRLDPDVAAGTARRFGAGLFVLGSVLEVGGQLQVDASLYDGADRPRVLSKASVRGDAGRIFEMVDQLVASLLAKRPGGPGARLTRIAALTTDSFPALKAYLEGEAEMRAARRATALDAYRRAVAEDPGFALAWYRLSVAALWSGQSHIAHEAARNAVERSSRLSDRDRDLLSAFDASLRGDNEEAERRYRAILGIHPDDVEAWYQLGELLFHCGPQRGHPIAESREAWERLVYLDPRHVNGLVHLGLIAASVGDAERFESSCRRVMELSLVGDPAGWVRAFRAMGGPDGPARAALLEEYRLASDYKVVGAINFLGAHLGNHAGAGALAGLLTEPVRSTEVRALGHILRAHFELVGGRWRAALRELDQAEALDPAPALHHRAFLASALFLERQSSELETIRQQVERLAQVPPPPRPPRPAWLAPHEGLHAQLGVYLAGILGARLGRPDEALAHSARLEAMGAPAQTGAIAVDMALSLKAHAAWADGRLSDALQLLEGARMQGRFDLMIWSPFYSQSLERYSRAVLLDRLSRHEEAVAWMGSFSDSTIYDQVYVAPSHLRRAEIFERLGFRERAADHYARFARMWRDCDEEFRPEVARAEACAARLGG